MWLGLPEGQPSSGEEAAAYGDPAGKEREARASTPVSLLQSTEAGRPGLGLGKVDGGSGGPEETPSGGLSTPLPVEQWREHRGGGWKFRVLWAQQVCKADSFSLEGTFRVLWRPLPHPSH